MGILDARLTATGNEAMFCAGMASELQHHGSLLAAVHSRGGLLLVHKGGLSSHNEAVLRSSTQGGH